ncbi:MAG: hypothetical protein WCD69_28700, partial [Xanthobacteraceae bacterium]
SLFALIAVINCPRCSSKYSALIYASTASTPCDFLGRGSAYPFERPNVRESLFGVGAAALLLLFIGIHNAWDAIVYHVFFSRTEQRESGEPTRPSADKTQQ